MRRGGVESWRWRRRRLLRPRRAAQSVVAALFKPRAAMLQAAISVAGMAESPFASQGRLSSSSVAGRTKHVVADCAARRASLMPCGGRRACTRTAQRGAQRAARFVSPRVLLSLWPLRAVLKQRGCSASICAHNTFS